MREKLVLLPPFGKTYLATVELLFSLLLGLGLSAATGLRVFLPALIASVAAQQGLISPAEGFAWLASWPAIIVFATASVLEIASYYVPWLDNALDTIAVPAAVIAGGLIATSFFQIESEALQWILGMIAGGAAAGSIQTGTTLLRGMSTASTGGLANPLVATGENLGAFFLSLLSVVAPALALVSLLAIVFLAWRRYSKYKRNRQVTRSSVKS